MNRRGTVALIAAAGMASVVGLGGVAIDGTRLWLVRSKLKASVDAAALAAARGFDSASREADARAIFAANFNPAGSGRYLGTATPTPTVTPVGTTRIRVSAEATVPLNATRWMNWSAYRDGLRITESATATRAGAGLELALVVDTTWSMSFSGGSAGATKLDAAKAAIQNLLNIIYSGSETQPDLAVSVVPFSVSVNIGTANTGWLTGSAPTYSSGFSWSGCVEARRHPEDVTDSPPNTTAARFYRYYWPSTYAQYGKSSDTNAKCSTSEDYSDRICQGDNDWTASSSVRAANAIIKKFGSYGAAFSPNAWCPTRPIQPLTARKSDVWNAVNALTSPFGYGTVIPVGLQAAWFTLSPRWQGYWPNPNGSAGAASPATYDNRNVRKVVILLSDGDNNWYSARRMNSDFGLSNLVAPENRQTELFYSAYGRITDRRLYNGSSPVAIANTGNLANDYTTTQRNADLALDSRTRLICQAMKDQGIIIYAIGFGIGNDTAANANRQLLRDCASGTTAEKNQFYFENPSAADLQNTFRQIAGAIARPLLLD